MVVVTAAIVVIVAVTRNIGITRTIYSQFFLPFSVMGGGYPPFSGKMILHCKGKGEGIR